MSATLTNFLKKSLRSKNFVILLLFVFAFYVCFNFFLFKWVGHSDDSQLAHPNYQHVDGNGNGDEYAKLVYEKEFFEKNQKAIPKQIVSI